MSSFRHMILQNIRNSRTQTVVTVAGILLSVSIIAAVVNFLIVTYDAPAAFLSDGSAVRSAEVRP